LIGGELSFAIIIIVLSKPLGSGIAMPRHGNLHNGFKIIPIARTRMQTNTTPYLGYVLES